MASACTRKRIPHILTVKPTLTNANLLPSISPQSLYKLTELQDFNLKARFVFFVQIGSYAVPLV